MARIPDEHLKEKILDVALALWRSQGEKGLTMRAIAQAAGTTTPSVYKRFPDKEAIVVALGRRARERYVKMQSRHRSLRDAAEGYLNWAITHHHEYQLIFGPYWHRILSEESGRKGMEWTRSQMAEEFGGKPEEYRSLAVGLWMMLHGAASLLSQRSAGESAQFIRNNCLAACESMLKNARNLRNKV